MLIRRLPWWLLPLTLSTTAALFATAKLWLHMPPWLALVLALLISSSGVAAILFRQQWRESRLHTQQFTQVLLGWGNGDMNARLTTPSDSYWGDLANAFNRAADKIQQRMQSHEALLTSQKALLANASHELRSPLARIRMSLELLDGAAPPQIRSEISRNISELDSLIEEILLASRVDNHTVELGPLEDVELVGLCAEECARCQAILDVQTTELHVRGVSKLLRRVIRNLLENARRYAGNDISLLLREEDQFAVLQVHDSGPGIPPDQQERIFEAFYRLPGASERDGGVGLGLALVKSIVTRHNGSVSCRNRSLGGACFEVKLPLQ